MAIQVNPSISHTQGWIDDNLTLKEFGFCLFHGDEIVSICCSLIFGNKMCDISIATAEAFRKRNFATLVVSAFIDSCAVKGVTPVWYCSPENLASNALARKLGFEEKETFGHFIVGSNQPTTDGKGCFFPLNYGNDLLNDSQRHRFCSILRRKHPN